MTKLKSRSILILFFISFLVSTKSSYSQINIHSVGFDIGGIGWEATNLNEDIILFRELFISGNFFRSDFNWKINLGYWDDSIDKPKIFDSPTYSYSSSVLGAELFYLLPITALKRPSPVRVFSGFSYHYVDADVVDNYGNWQNYSEYYTGNLFYLDAGMEIHILIHKELTMFLKGVGYFLLNNREVFQDNRWRFQYSLGVNYNFML